MNIYNMGDKYSYRWKSNFIETLDLPLSSNICEVSCYYGSIHPLFNLEDIGKYYIIDGGFVPDVLKEDEDVIIIDSDPSDALDKIPDNSLDLIYFDKFYDYKDAMKFIGLGFSKVKKNGWIAGSKYSYELGRNTEVTEAINDFARVHEQEETGKLDTRWIRFQEKKLPVIHDGEWRIKKLIDETG